MKRSLYIAGAAGLAVLGASTRASAQSADCRNRAFVDVHVEDACQKSVDLFNFLAPQLGTAIAGGNALLGQSGTLGLLHFSVGVRANAVAGDLPQTKNLTVSSTGAQSTSFETKKQVLPAPAVEAELGIFPGINLGLTSVGSLDAIASANYIPNYDNGNVSVKTDGSSLKFGFGGRLGILKESILVPGVSVTYLRRDLPTVSVAGAVSGTSSTDHDTVGVSGLAEKTTAIRGVIGKKFGIVGLTLGAGQDKYETSATVNGAVHDNNPLSCLSGCRASFGVTQSITRTSYFADLLLNLKVVKLVGEIGQVSGGSVAPTYNSFGGAQPDDSRTYGSVGLRFGY